MEVSGHIHASAALPPGREPQSWFGHSGEEKKSLHCLCQELNPTLFIIFLHTKC